MIAPHPISPARRRALSPFPIALEIQFHAWVNSGEPYRVNSRWHRSIEVKQPGKAEDAVRQALEYAFHSGVPFIVLTDGKSWSFYLPAEQGTYEERRVYKLDLFERSEHEAAEVLRRYVGYTAVSEGTALETARKEYRNRNRRSQARAAIPEAWRELVERGDELLVELVASAVESKSGIQPEQDDVAEFLASLGRTGIQYWQSEGPAAHTVPSTGTRQKPIIGTGGESPRRGIVVLRGKSYPYDNAKHAMVTILRELANEDPSFLERCSKHPDAQGRKRRYIARTTEELYPDRPDLRPYHETLPGGWMVATNLNNVLKLTIIKLAAEVAGLEFGRDVAVEF